MLEVTEYPDAAWSDAKQQLDFTQLTDLICSLLKY